MSNREILVVGGGGREHAIVRSLKKSPLIDKVYCAPGNAGIAADAECYPTKSTDVQAMVELAQRLEVGCVFVAQDDPLALGMVDALNEKGIRAFGPRKLAAEIESSKVFSKSLMKKYGIPTAAYETFTDPQKAVDYIRERGTYPTVIKADGLALGKGVVIAASFEEASEAVSSMMTDKRFGASGDAIVVEEFLRGPEVTVLAFTDGITVKPMVSSMDHKAAFDGNKGPNTGGMGAISPNPFYTEALDKRCMDEIFEPTVAAMRSEGRPFKGCLYFGLMITENGPKVIEYNCRFGDPEAQVVLTRLKTDLFEIVNAVIDEKLDTLDIEWDDNACACIVLASGGYPVSYEKGKRICGLDSNGQIDGATVFHAGTARSGEDYVTAGGRVLGVTATGSNVTEAIDAAYAAADRIDFEQKHCRRDIGHSVLQ